MQQQSHLHQELDKLKLKVMNMFALSEEAMNRSIQSLLTRDEDLAQKVIDNDERINRLEVEIDDVCLKLMAREQPVARDLRFVIGCSRICVELERIGDQAVNIAERAIMLSNRPPIPFNQPIQELADKTVEMYRMAVEAFTNRDVKGAVKVCQTDTQADELYIKLIKNLIDFLSTNTSMVERPVHTIMISKCLERMADLCTNVAEVVVFIERGVDIRHTCEMDQMKLISSPEPGA
ncbi:MAG: phosphate signaling complex protein PhoU [Desulfovibrionales bacterium]